MDKGLEWRKLWEEKYLKINQIKAGIDRITLTGCVISVSEKKEVETRFGKAYVANADLEDDTGQIVLNLWKDQIDMVARAIIGCQDVQ